jgi:hypothetical protein
LDLASQVSERKQKKKNKDGKKEKEAKNKSSASKSKRGSECVAEKKADPNDSAKKKHKKSK